MAEHPEGGPSGGRDFIRQIIDAHVAEGRYDQIVTRFPPEPNGYLHIGHAKSICLNFGLAREYGGRCHLRFDDTNPLTEDEEYTSSIQRDVAWLGYDWGPHLYHASDYFERMYEVAEGLIRKGKAYVDSSTEEEIREARGTVTEPGRPTRFRDRSVEENLDLFRRMRAGEFPDGAHVLRGKVDLASPNMIMRDPVFFRIRHAHHYRTGDDWCIYPLYDFAHCLEDAFEGISHSLCTLEFDNNREIYDWILDEAGFEEPRTHQYEFARLNLDYTVLSKRKLIRLVKEGHVHGWDDPRLPTIAGLRRRGVPPEAIRRFSDMVGVAKSNATVDVGKLEYAIRDTLNPLAPRLMAVVEPLQVVLHDWPGDRVETVEAPLYPDREEGPTRTLSLGGSLWIEAGDFMEDPPKGWRRLRPGGEVRLRHGYVIRCDEVVRDPDTGRVVELRCSHDPHTLGRNPTDRRVKGTIHWVSAVDARPAEFRLYDRLFVKPDADDVEEGEDFVANLNPDSLVVRRGWVEPAAVEGIPGEIPSDGAQGLEEAWDVRVQFERLGYFARDVESSASRPVFNRIVTLKDTWGRRMQAGPGTFEARGGEVEVDRRGAPERPGGASTGRGGPSGSNPPPAPPRVSEHRDAVRAGDPELAARFRRYQDEFALSELDADVLTGSRGVATLFDEALRTHAEPDQVAAWIINDVAALVDDGGSLDDPWTGLAFDGRALGTLVARVDDGTLNRRSGKEVLEEMARTGRPPEEIIREQGLEQVSDEAALLPLVEAVMSEFPDKVQAYRAGSTNLFGLFMGQVMRRSGGRADPGLVRTLLESRLDDA